MFFWVFRLRPPPEAEAESEAITSQEILQKASGHVPKDAERAVLGCSEKSLGLWCLNLGRFRNKGI